MKKTNRKKMMNTILIIVGIITVPILVVLIGGMMLPVNHTASVEKTFATKPDRIWSLLTDIEGQPKWRTDLKSIKVVSQDPVSWVETSGFGEIPMKVERIESNQTLVTRINSTELPFGGTWTFKLEPQGSSTKLTITEDGEVRQPVFRFLSKYVFGHTKTLNTYMGHLETFLKKEAV